MKTYSVDFTYIESDGSARAGEMFVPLSASRSVVTQEIVRDNNGTIIRVDNVRVGPWATNKERAVVELDESEMERLTALHGPHRHWRFAVTPFEGPQDRKEK